MAELELIQTLQRLLDGRKDIRLALLFGSQARGTAAADSDVDIAVDAPGLDLLTLGGMLSVALERDVDVIALDEHTPYPLLERILREGLVVHEAYPGAGALFRARTAAMLELDRPNMERMRESWLKRVREKGFG